MNGNEREALDPILDKCFEGWYLRHSKRTLRDVDEVFVAKIGDSNAGLVMLKPLDKHTGYVYYIAVDPEYRGKKISSRLLEFSESRFLDQGMNRVYASVSEDNVESNALFLSHFFKKTNYGELSKRFGKIGALNMYRKMLIVSGEIVLYKDIGATLV
ncbi:MAG: GNAT family N-acetyltransferase [Thaumarchaeota archaeon]|nr:GNAT family N-acetyltransferase [Nitrososphaerota archaeon]